jgi:hypothetical protein
VIGSRFREIMFSSRSHRSSLTIANAILDDLSIARTSATLCSSVRNDLFVQRGSTGGSRSLLPELRLAQAHHKL